ncbi:MAG: hypothetical protein KF729_04160 [Sandaracinaceae bacterium]|nr:hypothetical protein [Sandaracinaceae bacterium]
MSAGERSYPYRVIREPLAGPPSVVILTVFLLAGAGLGVGLTLAAASSLSLVELLASAVAGAVVALIPAAFVLSLALEVRSSLLDCVIQGELLTELAPVRRTFDLRARHTAIVRSRLGHDAYLSAWSLTLGQGEHRLDLLFRNARPPAALVVAGLTPDFPLRWMDDADGRSPRTVIETQDGFRAAIERALVEHRDENHLFAALAELDALGAEPAPRSLYVVDVTRGGPDQGSAYREGRPAPEDGSPFLRWLEEQPHRPLGAGRLTADYATIPLDGGAVRVFPIGATRARAHDAQVVLSGRDRGGQTLEASARIGELAMAAAIEAWIERRAPASGAPW